MGITVCAGIGVPNARTVTRTFDVENGTADRNPIAAGDTNTS